MQIMTQMMSVMLDAVDSVDVSAIGENICGILSEISDLNSECQVILLTVYDPFEGVQGMEMMDVAAREKLGELNAEKLRGTAWRQRTYTPRLRVTRWNTRTFPQWISTRTRKVTALSIRCCPG